MEREIPDRDRDGWPGPDRYKRPGEEPRLHSVERRYRDEEPFPPLSNRRGGFGERGGFSERGGRRDLGGYPDDPYHMDPYDDEPYRKRSTASSWEYDERARLERLRNIEERLDMELGIDRRRAYDIDR